MTTTTTTNNMYIAATPEQAARDFKQNGFTIVKALMPDECKDLILEQWHRILTAQGVDEDYQIQSIPLIKDNLHNEDYIVELLSSPNLSSVPSGVPGKTMLQVLTDRWVMHREFGACSDPQVFHLPLVWELVRGNSMAYHTASTILGSKRLHCDINRSIQRLPGQGMAELLHWDLNPFEQDWSAPPEGLGGKIVYTSAQFVCVPGSHTQQWYDTHFAPHFEHMRAGAKNKAKFEIPGTDAQGKLIRGMAQFIDVPAGHYIVWDYRLVHGTKRLPTRDTPIEFGAYLGFTPESRMFDADRMLAYEKAAEKARDKIAEQWRPVLVKSLAAENAMADSEENSAQYRVLGDQDVYDDIMDRPVSELEDRMYSFHHGIAPLLWPSLDPIQYTPAMWAVTLAPMVERIRRLKPATRARLVTANYVVNDHWTDRMGTTTNPLTLSFGDDKALSIGIGPKATEGRKLYGRWHLRIAAATPQPRDSDPPVKLEDLTPRAARLLGITDYAS